jgi:hypothetical protein
MISFIPESKCPKCGASLDAVSPVGDKEATPSEGDFSICGYCGTFLRFGEDLQIKTADNTDLNELFQDNPHVYRALIAARNKLQ